MKMTLSVNRIESTRFVKIFIEFCKIIPRLEIPVCFALEIFEQQIYKTKDVIKHDEIKEYGFEIFLDLKFHDIPNTVSRAVKASCNLGVWMINVHALGGANMMFAAKEAVDSSENKPLLIAVTILTSFDNSSYQELGFKNDLSEQVAYLAAISENSGMDGVVCSANDIVSIKNSVKENFKCITPGIRLVSNDDDQKRASSPKDALSVGSNYLVIGRPITSSKDPAMIIEKINQDIN